MYETSPDGRRLSLRWLLIGAVLLVLVAVAVTLLVVERQDSGGDAVASPTTEPTTAPSPTDPAPTDGESYESACGLRGGSLQMPTQEPADLKWERADGWAFPVSPSAGPGRRPADGPWSCFARTPMGAALAAYTIGFRLAVVEDFEAAVRQQVAPGVGQQALLQLGQEPAEDTVDTKGFVIESYSPDAAVVSYLLVQQGRNFTCSTEVQWRDGDWVLRALADGSTSSGCIESTPTRYVPWGDQ
ncbi:hypothetical protein [Aeromicrobium sp. IC_218]|uniref:hypothetical protein n=1 Tax=Aeromicrobium sp. IC_218 TaxID=2545468 RepID=UPI001039DBC2|nr:hypothetical protein [Aeromicrobium sp. IC_218]TCI96376.1 hypothetical protein E0W78_14680 [Aeromicrobium sp. IC_218]